MSDLQPVLYLAAAVGRMLGHREVLFGALPQKSQPKQGLWP